MVGAGPKLIFYNANNPGSPSSTPSALIGLQRVDNASHRGNMVFYTRGATNPVQRMVIDSNGNVGIGTTTPTTKLHVKNGHLRVEDGQAWFSRTSTSAPLAAAQLGVGPAAVFTGGNVGIGTSSPVSPLTVWGANDTTFDNIGNVTFIGTDAYDSNAGAGITFGGRYNSNNDVTTFGQISSIKENNTDGNYKAALTFGTRDGSTTTMEKMRIASDGKVGIGTTSPATSLEVCGAHGSQFRISRDSSTATQYCEIFGGASIMKFKSVSSTSANAAHSTFSFVSDDGTDELERMRINAAGNVGIGTDDPQAKLDVQGSINVKTGYISGSYAISNNATLANAVSHAVYHIMISSNYSTGASVRSAAWYVTLNHGATSVANVNQVHDHNNQTAEFYVADGVLKVRGLSSGNNRVITTSS